MKSRALIQRVFVCSFWITSIFEIVDVKNVKAQQTIVPCAATTTRNFLQNNGICTTAAQNYGMRIYQVGICRNDPNAGVIPDTSSCEFVYENLSGQYVDLGQSSANKTPKLENVTGVGQPANGTYDFIYLRIGNTIDLKGQATVQEGTYFSSNIPDGTGQVLGLTNPASYSIYPNVLTSLGGQCTEINGFEGSIKILNAALQPAPNNNGTCQGAAFASISANATLLLGNSLIITDAIRGIDLRFSTSTDAIGVFVNSGGDYVMGFLSFSLSLGLINS
jgi:hypothetical protein